MPVLKRTLQRPDLSTGDGLYKYTNAGETCNTSVCAMANSGSIVVDPHDANCLCVAVPEDIYRAGNGGKNGAAGHHLRGCSS